MSYEEVSEYVQRLVGEGDELLKWVSKRSNELIGCGVFQIGPSIGRLLELLARLRSPKRVLEIGSGAGYSAVWLMKGMPPDGILDTIELNSQVVEALKATIRKAGLEERIRIHHGRALDVLREMKEPYDMVFIDGDKDEYPNYLEEALRLTRPGSIIVADDMLWGGSAIRREGKERLRGITEYTKRIFNDSRLSSLIIPLGDAPALSYRTR